MRRIPLHTRRRAWPYLVAWCGLLSMAAAIADDPPGSPPPPAATQDQGDLARIEGQTVRVELASGVVYDEVAVSRIAVHSKTGRPQRLLGTTENGRRRTFRFETIRQISLDGQVVYVGQESPASESPAEEKLTKAERFAKQRSEQQEQWLARLSARGIKPWPPLTEEEHQAAIEKHKQRYQEVAKLLPSLQIYETEHFLFCSNIPPQQVGVFIASLDRMYTWMQQTYGVDPKQSVWRGKASVFAFVTEEQFMAFERQFMKSDPKPGTAGLCHYDSNRDVCIAVHQGRSADYFGVVLVHETSHGFIHCYQTPVRVPSWVNEGMAEVIAAKMVPSSDGVQRKEKSFLEAMRNEPQPRLGGAFFATDQNIPFDRYGGATNLTRFLIQTSQQKYVRFINLLKEGMPWEEAMQASFNANKQQLVSAYGQWVGIPQLMP